MGPRMHQDKVFGVLYNVRAETSEKAIEAARASPEAHRVRLEHPEGTWAARVIEVRESTREKGLYHVEVRYTKKKS